MEQVQSRLEKRARERLVWKIETVGMANREMEKLKLERTRVLWA